MITTEIIIEEKIKMELIFLIRGLSKTDRSPSYNVFAFVEPLFVAPTRLTDIC